MFGRTTPGGLPAEPIQAAGAMEAASVATPLAAAEAPAPSTRRSFLGGAGSISASLRGGRAADPAAPAGLAEPVSMMADKALSTPARCRAEDESTDFASTGSPVSPGTSPQAVAPRPAEQLICARPEAAEALLAELGVGRPGARAIQKIRIFTPDVGDEGSAETRSSKRRTNELFHGSACRGESFDGHQRAYRQVRLTQEQTERTSDRELVSLRQQLRELRAEVYEFFSESDARVAEDLEADMKGRVALLADDLRIESRSMHGEVRQFCSESYARLAEELEASTEDRAVALADVQLKLQATEEVLEETRTRLAATESAVSDEHAKREQGYRSLSQDLQKAQAELVAQTREELYTSLLGKLEQETEDRKSCMEQCADTLGGKLHNLDQQIREQGFAATKALEDMEVRISNRLLEIQRKTERDLQERADSHQELERRLQALVEREVSTRLQQADEMKLDARRLRSELTQASRSLEGEVASLGKKCDGCVQDILAQTSERQSFEDASMKAIREFKEALMMETRERTAFNENCASKLVKISDVWAEREHEHNSLSQLVRGLRTQQQDNEGLINKRLAELVHDLKDHKESVKMAVADQASLVRQSHEELHKRLLGQLEQQFEVKEAKDMSFAEQWKTSMSSMQERVGAFEDTLHHMEQQLRSQAEPGLSEQDAGVLEIWVGSPRCVPPSEPPARPARRAVHARGPSRSRLSLASGGAA